jgi:hypothetical protein
VPGAANSLLQSNGTGNNPSYTAAPTVAGTNITNLQPGYMADGNLPAGVVPTNVATPAHGGTGNDWSAVAQGNLPYFSGAGALSTLAPGTANSILQTNGAAANPSWTNAPTILGTNVTSIPAANIASGNLGSGVIPTNVATTAHGGTGNNWSAVAQGNVPYFSGTGTLATLAPGAANALLQSNGTGANPSYTSAPTISGANITGVPAASIASGNLGSGVIPTNIATTAHGGSGQDWSAVTAGRLPYFTGTGALGTLAVAADGSVLTLASGLPAWATSAARATNVAGGTTGSLPYQSAANTTAMLAPGTDGYVLTLSGGVPTWAIGGGSGPGGAVGDVQTNNGSGGFSGSSNFNFNGSALRLNGFLGLGVAARSDAAATIYTPAIGDATAPGIVFGDYLGTDDHARNSTAILGAPYHLADKPFAALGTFANAGVRAVYMGGDGNGHPDANQFHILVSTSSDQTDNAGIEAVGIYGDDTSFAAGAGVAYINVPVNIDPGVNSFLVDVSTQLVVNGGGPSESAADVQIGGCVGCTPSGSHLKFDYDGLLDPTHVAMYIDNQGAGNNPTAIRMRTYTFPSTMVENLTLLNTGFVGVGNTSPTNTLTVGGTPVTWYYCSGSTSGLHDGALMRGNGNAANLCPGGTAVATKISSE